MALASNRRRPKAKINARPGDTPGRGRPRGAWGGSLPSRGRRRAFAPCFGARSLYRSETAWGRCRRCAGRLPWHLLLEPQIKERTLASGRSWSELPGWGRAGSLEETATTRRSKCLLPSDRGRGQRASSKALATRSALSVVATGPGHSIGHVALSVVDRRTSATRPVRHSPRAPFARPRAFALLVSEERPEASVRSLIWGSRSRYQGRRQYRAADRPPAVSEQYRD
jgi:hypothetical protein